MIEVDQLGRRRHLHAARVVHPCRPMRRDQRRRASVEESAMSDQSSAQTAHVELPEGVPTRLFIA